MADLTPDLQVRLSWGVIAESFHSLQSLSVSCFHVILGLPGPRFPSTCLSKADLTAPLEHSTCPYHRSLLSFRMRSRSSMPSRTSSSLDLVVTMSCSLTLQYYCWKIVSRFCKCKSYSHFFSKNISVYAIFNDQNFNDTLTNDIVSFEQLGPDLYQICIDIIIGTRHRLVFGDLHLIFKVIAWQKMTNLSKNALELQNLCEDISFLWRVIR